MGLPGAGRGGGLWRLCVSCVILAGLFWGGGGGSVHIMRHPGAGVGVGGLASKPQQTADVSYAPQYSIMPAYGHHISLHESEPCQT
jgi:hypothetical protein